jgi:hypothetical protein
MIVRSAGVAGRVVQQRTRQRALRQPRQEHSNERERQQRFSGGVGRGALSRRMEFLGQKSPAALLSGDPSTSIPVPVSCLRLCGGAKTRRGGGVGSQPCGLAKAPPPYLAPILQHFHCREMNRNLIRAV